MQRMSRRSSEETCVALISDDPRMRLEDTWENSGACARSECRVSGVIEASDGDKQVEPSAPRKVILTGDASGSVDAITGEGLCLSFRQPSRLPIARVGQIETYQARTDAVEGDLRLAATCLAWAIWKLRQRALQVR